MGVGLSGENRKEGLRFNQRSTQLIMLIEDQRQELDMESPL